MVIVNFESVVYTNQYPQVRSEHLSGTSLARSGGTLWCAFRSGSARMSPDGRVRVVSSVDGGLSWSMTSPDWASVADTDTLRTFQTSGAHLGASESGTVVLVAARMQTIPPEDPAWDESSVGIVDADCVISTYGHDGWSKPSVLDARRHGDEWAIPCGPPVEIAPGRWFLPVERHAKTYLPDWLTRYHASSVTSSDDGHSWEPGFPMLNDPRGGLAHYDQHIAVIPGGELVSLAWAHDVRADRTLTARAGWSSDGGRSWSAPVDTTIVGGPVAVSTLPDGRLFAVYPRRVAPVGIRACLSEDGGRTWRTDQEFVIWDGLRRRVGGDPTADIEEGPPPPLWNTMWSWTFGSPCPTVLDSGEVGVAFYAVDAAGSSTVRYVRVEP